MNIKELREYFEQQPDGKIFKHGLSLPFSWRGSCDEVAFSILPGEFTKQDILEKINSAKVGAFFGYKGGEFKYDDYTLVNFEESPKHYSDGGYLFDKIFELLFG